MKRLLILLAFLPILVSATIGGNLTSLRPAFTPADLAKTQLSASYLQKGANARFSAIWWEIFWTPDSTKANFAGIDKMLEICGKGGLNPIILISPTPYPTSPWNAGADWWLPARGTWDKIRECNLALIKHVQAVFPGQILWQLMNEPAGKMSNPPLGEKPGGSNQTIFGEWTVALHELLFRTATDLISCGIPASQIVSPAISCVGEGNKRETVEWLTFTPPAQFDWLSLCGTVALHIRFDAAWATDPATRLQTVNNGFVNCADYAQLCIDHTPSLAGKRILLTEVYVAPADCGAPIGTDLDPYRIVAVGLCEKHNWGMVVYGLLPDETDGAGNPWLTYGGWGDFLRPAIKPSNNPG